MRIAIDIIMTPEGTEYEKKSNIILPVGKYTIELTGETFIENKKVITKGYIEYELPIQNTDG